MKPRETFFAGGPSLVAIFALTAFAAHAAPLPPMAKIDITGTIQEVKWVPKEKRKGKIGYSGSLGHDRVIPAHLVVTLRGFSGPTAKTAWLLNGYMKAPTTGRADRTQMPTKLVIWITTEVQDLLKEGMKIRVTGYQVRGDEGGTWTSHDKLDVLRG